MSNCAYCFGAPTTTGCPHCGRRAAESGTEHFATLGELNLLGRTWTTLDLDDLAVPEYFTAHQPYDVERITMELQAEVMPFNQFMGQADCWLNGCYIGPRNRKEQYERVTA